MNQKLLEKARDYRFAIMILAAVVVALILTSISITIYVVSGAINIDLSRPDFEAVRENVDSSQEIAPFSPTGPIDRTVAEDLNQRLEAIQTEINQMNDFSAEALSDQALNLGQ